MSQPLDSPTPGIPEPGYLQDQLVVDTGDLDTVADMLRRLGITWALKQKRGQNIDQLADEDLNDTLGLARLTQIQDHANVALDVGDLLGFLRQRFAAERDGWVPLMGKNRFVDGVIGEGHKPHAATYPIAVTGDQVTDYLSANPPPGPGTGAGIRVGMIDTSRDLPDPEEDGPHPFRAGHGAFVADLITQQAPGVTLDDRRVLNGPLARACSWTTGRKIVELAQIFKPHVLNLSLGCCTMSGGPPLVISRAIERVDPGILIVAAAGNYGDFTFLENNRDRHSAVWPAALPNVIAVGAVDASWAPPSPNWSPELPWVDVVARGVDVVARYFGSSAHPAEVDLDDGSTLPRPFTGYASWSGTSFAAAVVSGAVAATMTPGGSPHDALAELLEAGSLVKRFDHARLAG